ncbi:MAG TPA: hypothetical protein DCY98_01455 [Nitrospinae bacterium]|nr:hypothetical protein [Nitrospinota bacterium]
MVDYSNKKRKKFMRKQKVSVSLLNKLKDPDTLMKQPCSECGDILEKGFISQEFEREGIKIRLSGIKAWVCRGCGETYFQPGGANKVVKAANCLFELAQIEKQHKGTLAVQI